MVGRKNQPTALKLIKGNPSKAPLNVNEPQPEKITQIIAPDFLSKEAKKEYVSVAKLLTPIGLMTSADTRALEVYSETYATWKEATMKVSASGMVVKSPNGYPIQNPYLSIANQAAKRMQSLLSEFGMTPSSRTRFEVDGGTSEDSNPYSKI
jgi:P27 family predicted phage terminase small subunit